MTPAREQLWTAALFVGMLLLGTAAFSYSGSEIFRFGWEYGNIAEALARGRGFSDAMAPGSGPTGWMPPLLPALYAVIFLAAGVKTPLSLLLICFLRALAGGASLYYLQGWCRHLGGHHWARGSVLLAVLWLLVDRQHSLCDLNDQWFINLCCCLTLTFLLRLQESHRPSVPWMAVAALMPLASPPCALAILLGLGWRRRTSTGTRAGVAILILLSGLAWTVRNRLVLGSFHVVKSNFWVAFVESNLYSRDGLVTLSLFDRYNPVKPNPAQERYLALGEERFLEESRRQAAEVAPQDWLKRSARRLGNVVWCLQSEVDLGLAEGLTPEDWPALVGAGLLEIKQGQPVWLFLYQDEKQVDEILRDLPGQARMASSRNRALENLERVQGRWDFRLWSYAFTLLPAVSSLLLLGGWRHTSREARLGLFCYWLFLAPYVLVHHYARYQLSTLYLQIFLEMAALSKLVGGERK